MLNNAKRHAPELGEAAWLERSWVDPYTSAAHFDGWRSALSPLGAAATRRRARP